MTTAAAAGTGPAPVTAASVSVGVLGPLQVRRDDVEVATGAPKQRALLAALATTPGRPVAVDTLVDLLWGDDAPPGVLTTVQAYVSQLRKALEPDRERRAAARLLVTRAPGYALDVPADAVDAVRFEAVVTAEHARLAQPLLGPAPLPRADLVAAVERLDAALGLWRGVPYVDLGEDLTGPGAASGGGGSPGALGNVAAERHHLEELRLVALEDRAVARLALGQHAPTAAELEVLTDLHPLRERLWALRALALVRAGRQADALDALARVREVLADELGLDPGAELRDLQARVLAQDPGLAWSPPAGTDGPPDAATPATPVTGTTRAGTPDGTTAGAPRAATGTGLPTERGWPLLGRDTERARLVALLERARAGTPGFAVLVGEPGIGKSRLAAEVARGAAEQGVRVVVGRCSQDDGAPPLWPWSTVLEGLGATLAHGEREGGEFAAWTHIVDAVLGATGGPGAGEPLVVVLDDLHWADTATLRALRLLVERATTEPLLVVVTWRSHPAPTGALADVAEALARAHAERLDLTGLDAAAAAGLVDALAGRRPSAGDSEALRERTDGNPFFLVEYARLAAARPDLGGLLEGEERPAAVQDVLARRIGRLPEDTQRLLRVAAVVGRRFDLGLLARAARLDEDEVLDVLEPAQVAGLVREDAVDVLVFDHALVRDTAYDGLSPTRRARLHAAVARELEGTAGRETEVARHWLAAGPGAAPQAWRAALAAGRVALRAHAHPEAMALLDAALTALRDDPAAGPRERYDVLLERGVAARWAAHWTELTETVAEAVAAAQELGDPVLAAEAAVLTLRGALWQSARHGGVHEGVVRALRASLEALPAEDSAIRARCLVALAGELYYVSAPQERRALVDEAVAMAHRLGDPAVLLDVLAGAFNAIWMPGTEDERRGYAERSVELARATGDEHAEVVALTQLAISANERGLVEQMWALHAEALTGARRLRLPYALIVLQSMVAPWYAMAGELDTCRAIYAEVLAASQEAAISQAEEGIQAVVVSMLLWGPRDEAAEVPEEMLAGLDASPLPTTAPLTFLLWRLGEEDRARRWLAERDAEIDGVDWFSILNWGYAAACGLFVGDADLAAAAYARLAPYAGQLCVGGSGIASGPVDAYLALGAAGCGEVALATRHADDAERLAAGWGIPRFTTWFAEQRTRWRF